MAEYPESVFGPRVVANVDGTIYEPNQTTRIFAEDVNLMADEIVAIENTLGLLPAGNFPTVGERIQNSENNIENIGNAVEEIIENDTKLVLFQGATHEYVIPGWTHSSGANTSISTNNLHVIPIRVHETTTFDRVGFRVRVAAGTLARMAIYNRNGNNVGSLLEDFGTVPTNAVANVENIINLTLEPELYFLTIVANGAVGTLGGNIAATLSSPIRPIKTAYNGSDGFNLGIIFNQAAIINNGYPQNLPSQPLGTNLYPGAPYFRKAL